MIKAAIIGGSGYTGSELARLLCRHPKISLETMTSRQNAGTHVSKLHPYLEGYVDLKFEERLPESARYDLVFVAAPHGASMDIVPGLVRRGMRVIDLSGDYRLTDPAIYSKWYGLDHKDPENLGKAVYAIPEICFKEIEGAQLVANPGCYPTCATLGLAPLFSAGLVTGDRAIVDAKSGTSGAGQEPTKMTHHPTCAPQVIPYKIGSHRHTPEIKRSLCKVTGTMPEIIFTPHLVPIVRGMLCTSYVSLNKDMELDDLYELYRGYYSGRRFVRMTQIPSVSAVVGSNYCEIGLALCGESTAVAMSVIDNLVKGASGQAIQNANIMFGIEETTGLDFPGLGV
jgi:N-acetyl-gamma-glutamyl-phosphate reductase